MEKMRSCMANETVDRLLEDVMDACILRATGTKRDDELSTHLLWYVELM